MSEEITKRWVICWKPFDPTSGAFISNVDFSNKPRCAVQSIQGVRDAMRFSKAEIPFMMEEIGNFLDIKVLMPVDLGDHDYN